MRTDLISFVMGSESRKAIVKTLFEYPSRQWSCSSVEELTNISHATVFRTLRGLKDFGLLKSTRINKKDILYELVSASPLSKELRRIVDIERIVANRMAKDFVGKIRSKEVYSAVLYGSTVAGNVKPDSDIDILIILTAQNPTSERRIFDLAAEFSSRVNKTISITVMARADVKKRQNKPFMESVVKSMEVLYGEKPLQPGSPVAGVRKVHGGPRGGN